MTKFVGTKAEYLGELLFCIIPGSLAAFLGVTAMLVNFANVIARYAFSTPLVWAEELMAYSLIWIVFLGSIVVTWRREHLSVDLWSNSRSTVGNAVFQIAVDILLLTVCAIVILMASRVVNVMLLLGKTSVILGIPMATIHAAVLVGFSMQALSVFWRWGLIISGARTVDCIGKGG